MSDKIRIKSIELENYRQYYGKHKIDFSSREEGFTIIAGKNGEGKSNLLNAISWCLYHQEPHGMGDDIGHGENRSLPVINTRYITELKKDKIATTSVKIWIEKGDTIYSMSRVLTVLKHDLEFKNLADGRQVLMIAQEADDKVPNGCEILPKQKNFVIKEKRPDSVDFEDTRNKGDPTVIMNSILPEGLSKYFLLDGEFLEGFWKDTKIIQNGIEQISQLHLLSSLANHVSDMCIMPKGGDKETDSLTTQINLLLWKEKSCDESGNDVFSRELRWKEDSNSKDAYYHTTGTPRMKELQEDLDKIKRRINEISRKIGGSNSQTIEHLKKEKINLEAKIETGETDLEHLTQTYRYNLITRSPYVFLKKAIENSVSIIEERTKAGDLPIRQKKQFAQDLLNRGICICGESLGHDTGDHAAKVRSDRILEYKNTTLGKVDLDAAVDMKYDFKHDFAGQYNDFLKKTFGDPQRDLARVHDELDGLKHHLQAINLDLGKYGDEETTTLLENQQQLVNDIQRMTQQISEIKSELKSDAKSMQTLRVQLNKQKTKDQKRRKLAHEYEVWFKILGHVKRAYEELKKEIRQEVQESTWKNFRELLANPTEFHNFSIESDYSVYLLDKHNSNKIHNLSAGQSLILTLAFVAAIREPTGYRFPLVIDSPLGKIDGGNRYNIGTRIPDYLPEEQLTLLVTDTEYVAVLPPDPDHPDMPMTSVAQLLNKKIGLKHFKINKTRSGANSGNSVVLPAKLELDKIRKTWMVSTSV